jgi:hypothetical protein
MNIQTGENVSDASFYLPARNETLSLYLLPDNQSFKMALATEAACKKKGPGSDYFINSTTPRIKNKKIEPGPFYF